MDWNNHSSMVLSLGCFAFQKQWGCMMRISAERAVEFLPCVLGSVPLGWPPTLNSVDTLWASCITLLFPLILSLKVCVCVCALTYEYTPTYSLTLYSSIRRIELLFSFDCFRFIDVSSINFSLSAAFLTLSETWNSLADCSLFLKCAINSLFSFLNIEPILARI